MLDVQLSTLINNPTNPTIRKFYLSLFSCLEKHDIKYRIIPEYTQKSVLGPKMIDRILSKLDITGPYFTPHESDQSIKYHTRDEENINVKISYLPSYFYFDETGYSGWATIANNKPPFEEMNKTLAEEKFETISQNVINSNISKYHQPAQSPTDNLPNDYIFLPTQVEDDEVSKLADVEIYDLVKNSVEEIPKLGYELVIKRHPKCDSSRMSDLLDEVGEFEKVHIVDYSVHDLIEESSAVVVVNSGVGFESLLHLKPVISFGHSDYHWAVARLNRIQEIEKIPEIIDRYGDEERTKVKKFVSYYLSEYLVNINDESSFERAFKRTQLI